MQFLTIIRTPGDPDQLLAAKREHMDPTLENKVGQHGNIFHVTARGPDGVVVVNLWESKEASDQAARDPDVQKARDAFGDSGAATGPPDFSHYEVADYRSAKDG